MAMVVFRPVATCHAAGAPIICRFHCTGKAGSFGVDGVAAAGGTAAPKPSAANSASRSAPQRVIEDRTTCPLWMISTGRPPSPPGRGSEATQDGDDLAEDRDAVGVELDRLEAGVGRGQDDLAALAGVGLDGALFAGKAGDDDVALLGRGLRSGDDVVAVEDAGVDHRVAPYAEHEQVAVASEVGGQRQQLLDVLLREDVGSGGDVAHERDVAGGAAL